MPERKELQTVIVYIQALDKRAPSLQMLLFVKTRNGNERIKLEGKLPFSSFFLLSPSIHPVYGLVRHLLSTILTVSDLHVTSVTFFLNAFIQYR